MGRVDGRLARLERQVGRPQVPGKLTVAAFDLIVGGRLDALTAHERRVWEQIMAAQDADERAQREHEGQPCVA